MAPPPLSSRVGPREPILTLDQGQLTATGEDNAAIKKGCREEAEEEEQAGGHNGSQSEQSHKWQQQPVRWQL